MKVSDRNARVKNKLVNYFLRLCRISRRRMPFGDIVSDVAPLINGGELLKITTGVYLFLPGEKVLKLTKASASFSTRRR